VDTLTARVDEVLEDLQCGQTNLFLVGFQLLEKKCHNSVGISSGYRRERGKE